MMKAVKSILKGSTEFLQGITGLADSFSQLGLSPDMVSQFTPVILDFVQKNGGSSGRCGKNGSYRR